MVDVNKVAIIIPILTAMKYRSKYRDAIAERFVCSAPNTARLDLTAPAPIALDTRNGELLEQVNTCPYMTINATFIQLVRCSLAPISVLRILVLFTVSGEQDVGESVASMQAIVHPIK